MKPLLGLQQKMQVPGSCWPCSAALSQKAAAFLNLAAGSASIPEPVPTRTFLLTASSLSSSAFEHHDAVTAPQALHIWPQFLQKYI